MNQRYGIINKTNLRRFPPPCPQPRPVNLNSKWLKPLASEVKKNYVKHLPASIAETPKAPAMTEKAWLKTLSPGDSYDKKKEAKSKHLDSAAREAIVSTMSAMADQEQTIPYDRENTVLNFENGTYSGKLDCMESWRQVCGLLKIPLAQLIGTDQITGAAHYLPRGFENGSPYGMVTWEWGNGDRHLTQAEAEQLCKPGDLVVYAQKPGMNSHVVVYLGNGEVAEASYEGCRFMRRKIIDTLKNGVSAPLPANATARSNGQWISCIISPNYGYDVTETGDA